MLRDQPGDIGVLVTGAGGPAAIAVLKSLRADPSVRLIAADMDGWAAGLYLVPAADRVVIPAGDAPGFAEAMRAEALKHTPMGILSRGVSGIAGRTLIVNFPGNPKAIGELFPVIGPTLGHVVTTLQHEGGPTPGH